MASTLDVAMWRPLWRAKWWWTRPCQVGLVCPRHGNDPSRIEGHQLGCVTQLDVAEGKLRHSRAP